MFISETEFINFSDYYYPPYDNFKWAATNPVGLYKNKLNSLKDKTKIYLHLDYLKEFIDIILPEITVQFILITGFSDFIVPYLNNSNKNENSNLLLNSEKLLYWFGVNVFDEHPKIIKIPIGIPRNIPRIFIVEDNKDYNYMSWYRENFNYIEVNNKLNEMMIGKDRMTLLKNKKESNDLIYISYSIVTSNDSSIKEHHCFRIKLNEYLKNNTNFKINTLVDCFQNYELIMKYKYVLCPFGRGPDTYRTWETLILGSVPIVFSSTINELYTDLPVLIIENFEQLNEDYLNEQYNKIISKDTYKFDKLNTEYWKNILEKYYVL